jgi:YWFCY protein/Type IV secretory system Conjugative DNA transfer
MQLQREREFRQIRLMCGGLSIGLLVLHLYFSCYRIFEYFQMTHPILDRLVGQLARSGFITRPTFVKSIALVLLFFCRIGLSDGGAVSWKRLVICFVSGGLLFFCVGWLADTNLSPEGLAMVYIPSTAVGFFLLYRCFAIVQALLGQVSNRDIFNRLNESFPQQEKLVQTPYSVNLPGRYRLRNTTRRMWVNDANVFRGSICVGLPGSGKTRYFFRPAIFQLIEKQFCGLLFDFKFDNQTKLAHYAFQKYKSKYAVEPQFRVINFDDLSKTHRCNPIDPATMHDVTDALEAAKIILLALNKEWVRRQGDFFVESAISFVTANIWFLRKYQDGKFCTLPHLIELIQCDYSRLFSVLRSVPEVESLIGTFVSAFLSNSLDQLEGQVASARIALSSLASPNLYYVMSEHEFSLDLNNPASPKILCLGSNPQKQMLYGAVLSLYVSRAAKLMNRPGLRPSFVMMDEFAQIYWPSVDVVLATGREHLIAPFLGVQSIDQLRKEYGREQADVIFNLPGNLIAGQSNGDTARFISERVGKILQPKVSVSVNSRDASLSQSEQLDYAIPQSKISNLSSGEFVGIMSDDPALKITLKSFHCQLEPDTALEKELSANPTDLPAIRKLGSHDVEDCFHKIKSDIRQLLTSRLQHMEKSPILSKLIIRNDGENTGKGRKHPGRS